MELKVDKGSKAYELQNSKDKNDQKKAKQLIEFCRKASECNYEWDAMQKLRKEYGL